MIRRPFLAAAVAALVALGTSVQAASAVSVDCTSVPTNPIGYEITATHTDQVSVPPTAPAIAVMDTGVANVPELSGRLRPGYNVATGDQNTTDIDGLFTNQPGVVWCSNWNWLESSGDPKPEDIPDEFVEYVQAIEDRKMFMPRDTEDAKRFQIIADFYRDTYWALVSATKQPVPCWISENIGNDVISGTAVGMLDALAIWYFKE